MSAPPDLQRSLSELLGDAQLVACELPGTALQLWLIDAHNMDRAFTPEETRRILHEPPYWSFCWASGLAMARYLAENPHWVAGKRVLDFGAGSGVAAIAAARAGALEVVACDLDPLALAACRANAALNGVELSYSEDFFAESDRFDLILVADVLYDRENLPLLDQFLDSNSDRLPHAVFGVSAQGGDFSAGLAGGLLDEDPWDRAYVVCPDDERGTLAEPFLWLLNARP